MRIGIVALLHESNTFSSQPTTLESFRENLLLTGEPIRDALVDAHHEVGGFFAGIDAAGAEAVPLFAARALPSGTIRADSFDALVSRLLQTVQEQLPLDGILVAPHGATVSQQQPDADGYWLAELRRLVGSDIPIIGTLDAHANLSPRMVGSCNALVAYRTNPHLDQRSRGVEAADLMVQTLSGKITPVMSAAFPPMAISIEKQCTQQSPLCDLYDNADQQRQVDGVLSNSILLGFPYADVQEMGASVLTVTDGSLQQADQMTAQLASAMWNMREDLKSTFVSVDQAITRCQKTDDRVCLLDMGDNVGGGSSADATELLAAIHHCGIGPAFGCLYDPESVEVCLRAGCGKQVGLEVGGKTDAMHGDPLHLVVEVVSIHEGKFHEAEPRHGGISDFDQGRTAICRTESGLTLMLTSRRMVPFSLQQLRSCNLHPSDFRLLVAKGVNAPLAAYGEVCERFIQVNTMGSTSADLSRLTYQYRRSPMFPLEPQATFDSAVC